jgi:hypothetical protein
MSHYLFKTVNPKDPELYGFRPFAHTLHVQMFSATSDDNLTNTADYLQVKKKRVFPTMYQLKSKSAQPYQISHVTSETDEQSTQKLIDTIVNTNDKAVTKFIFIDMDDEAIRNQIQQQVFARLNRTVHHVNLANVETLTNSLNSSDYEVCVVDMALMRGTNLQTKMNAHVLILQKLTTIFPLNKVI